MLVDQPSLKVAICLSAQTIAPWQRLVIEALAKAAGATIIATLSLAPGRPGTAAARLVDRIERASTARLFARIFGAARRADEQPVPRTAVIAADIPHFDGDNPSQRERLAALAPDLIVDLRDRTVIPIDLPSPLGTWRLTFGTARESSSALLADGFGAVRDGTATTSARLIATTPDGTRRCLLEGCFRTFPWSWSENERQLRLKAAMMFTDALACLERDGRGWLAERPLLPARPENGSHRRPERTTGLEAVAALAACWTRIISEALDRTLREETWRLYIARGTPDTPDLTETSVIEPGPSSYWADPFAVTRNGRTYIFFEEFPYATRKGVISMAPVEITAAGIEVGPARRIIEQPTHLSYPFLLEHAGSLLMIPESSADRTIPLWRCEQFPDRWVKVANLIDDISATDTTLIEHEGRWWLFTNVDRAGIGDHCSELHVFHAADPLAGTWTPHPLNPVVRDARSARMAGPIHRTADGRLVRPAQVNTRYYGTAITLQEIHRLDTNHYEETCLRYLAADWRPEIYRSHHIAPLDGHVIVDGCRNHFKIAKRFKALFRGHQPPTGADPAGMRSSGRACLGPKMP